MFNWSCSKRFSIFTFFKFTFSIKYSNLFLFKINLQKKKEIIYDLLVVPVNVTYEMQVNRNSSLLHLNIPAKDVKLYSTWNSLKFIVKTLIFGPVCGAARLNFGQPFSLKVILFFSFAICSLNSLVYLHFFFNNRNI